MLLLLLWFYPIKQQTSCCTHFLVLFFVPHLDNGLALTIMRSGLSEAGSATFNEHLPFWRCSNFMNLTVIKRHKFRWNKHLFFLLNFTQSILPVYSISSKITYANLASSWSALCCCWHHFMCFSYFLFFISFIQVVRNFVNF